MGTKAEAEATRRAHRRNKFFIMMLLGVVVVCVFFLTGQLLRRLLPQLGSLMLLPREKKLLDGIQTRQCAKWGVSCGCE